MQAIETDVEWARTIKDRLARENAVGGELTAFPCPFCKRPRSQRSDYVRCNPCGVNWLPGEDLNKDPKIQRYRDMVASMKAATVSA